MSSAVSSNGPIAASEANQLPMRLSIHGKAKKVKGTCFAPDHGTEFALLGLRLNSI